MRRLFLVGAAVAHCAILAWSAVSAQQDLRAEYERELASQAGEWVVVGNHFRHSDNCTVHGCIVMGPMIDQEACEEWSRDYNLHDPLDHTTCVDATKYQTTPY